ncbi:MAG TPA: hypothetical protein DCS07_00350 [Bdellovibrionales bacterium]|nr:hypothetical protein [Bdellovibrionales bacterium]
MIPIGRKHACLLLLLALSLISGGGVHAASDAVQKLAYWETKANALANRSDKQIMLQHYEIPLEMIDADFAKSLPPNIRESLIFQKEGKTFVRWIINPEDTKWHKRLEAFLKSKGASTTKYNYFKAYHTASRSMLIEDPNNGAEFSAKVSTDMTGGDWVDKQQTVSDARQIRAVDDYSRGISNRIGGFENFVIMDEPATLGIKGLDQGMVIRMLNDLPSNEHYYLPGFSAVHDKVGREIALLNGSSNPATFWNENYNKPLARAMAELNAFTGLSYSSPHSQNFLVELDKKMKPTGRIVFRDLGDSNIRTKFINKAGQDAMVDIWDSTHHKATVHAKVGILKGNHAPSWLPDSVYEKQWAKDFYAEYEKTLSRMIGVPAADLQKTSMKLGDSDYFAKIYDTKDQAWNRFFNIARCLDPKRPVKLKSGERCADILNTAKKGAKKAVSALAEKKVPAVFNERTAAEVWNDLQESSLTRKPLPIGVSGSPEVISYGGEKEGSSSIITRIMGPDKKKFAKFVSELSDESRVVFLRNFLNGWAEGTYRNDEVRDVNGMLIRPKGEPLKGVDFDKLGDTELKEHFASWLDSVGDRNFSFIKGPIRRKLFNGDFPGLEKNHHALGKFAKADFYESWLPLYGPAEKYISSAHATSVGWELNFLPQPSFGEFEEMVDWFRDTLTTGSNRFEAPGHQWLVYPKRPGITPEKAAQMEGKLAEMYRNTQAYIILKGIEGKSGIEFAQFKAVHADSAFSASHQTSRGVLRLDDDRFGAGNEPAYNLELRAGTKSDKTRRFTQEVVSARYAAAEFDDLADIKTWNLIASEEVTVNQLRERFGVSRLEAEKVIDALSNTEILKRGGRRTIHPLYWVPFWTWENAPYVSSAKRDQLRTLTRSFIKSVASWQNPTVSEIKDALATWIKASNLTADIEAYLKPKFTTSQDLATLHEFRPIRAGPASTKALVDVNNIDLGIEYSGRFPIKYQAHFSEPLIADKRTWLATQFDYTMEERKNLIRQVAEDLGSRLNSGKAVKAVDLAQGGHGHSLVIAYEVKDPQGRSWRVEWDGVGRDYDPLGEVLVDSGRGGHLELVTPKFKPKADEMKAVFETFSNHSLVPSIRAGGGHINIDLAAFDKKPKALARFLSNFLENRGTMAMMFQHIGRLKSAEPLDISPKLAGALKDFNGTEEELKRLLYDEGFFNTRLGRKTRYSQLDISAYFQDVIPPELITADFDLKNDLWRKSFNVDPKIRKAEFRLFNAPRSLAESELQIKLIRAMLDKALNEDSPLSGFVQKVDYEEMVSHPEEALKQFEAYMSELKLNVKEYRAYFLDGLSASRDAIESRFYEPLAKRLAEHPKQGGWGKAVPARPWNEAQALSAKARPWDGSTSNPAALEAARERQALNNRGFELRAEMKKDRTAPKLLSRMNDGRDLGQALELADFRKLDTHTALVALYQKRGLSRQQYNEILSELAGRTDYPRTLIREFSEITPETSSSYGQWLLSTLREGDEIPLMKFLLPAADPDLRKMAYERLGRRGIEEIFTSGGHSIASASSVPGVKQDYLNFFAKRSWESVPEFPEFGDSIIRRLTETAAAGFRDRNADLQIPAAKILTRLKSYHADRTIMNLLSLPGLTSKEKRLLLLSCGDRVNAVQTRILATLMHDPDPAIARQATEHFQALNKRFLELPLEQLKTMAHDDQFYALHARIRRNLDAQAAREILGTLPVSSFAAVIENHKGIPGLDEEQIFAARYLLEKLPYQPDFRELEPLLNHPNETISRSGFEFLKSLPESRKRSSAHIQTITRARDESVLKRLLNVFPVDRIVPVQGATIDEALATTTGTKLLEKLSATQDGELQLKIAQAFGPLWPMSRPLPEALALLAEASSPATRIALLEMLSSRPQAAALLGVTLGLRDQDPKVRAVARKAQESLDTLIGRMSPLDFEKIDYTDLLVIQYRFQADSRIQGILKPLIARHESGGLCSTDLIKLLTTARKTGQHDEPRKISLWLLNTNERLMNVSKPSGFAALILESDAQVRKLAFKKLSQLSGREASYRINEVIGALSTHSEGAEEFLRFLETYDYRDYEATLELRVNLNAFRDPQLTPLARRVLDRVSQTMSLSSADSARCAVRNILGILREL